MKIKVRGEGIEKLKKAIEPLLGDAEGEIDIEDDDAKNALKKAIDEMTSDELGSLFQFLIDFVVIE